MKYLKIYISAFYLTLLSAGIAGAQESDISRKYHPFLSDNFHIGLGVYRPSKKAEIGADLDLAPDSGDSLEASESQSTGILNLRWRFTENWHFKTTYWNTDSESQQTLTDDFEFGGETFQAGSFVGMGVDTSITRLFWGRSLFRKPNHDWGVGLGLHWMEIEAFVEGQVLLAGGGGTELRNEGASASAPLPNLGIWYMYSWSPNWVLVTRLDWLEVSIDEFSGSMYDASVGVNYQISDHFGLGFAINGFKLDVEVDWTDGRGVLVSEQIGPRLNATWSW